MIRTLAGVLRMTGVALIIFIGTIIVFLIAWLPNRYREARLSAWVITWMARSARFVFGVRLRVPDLEVIVSHRGLVFPNHVSFLDIILMMSLAPMRFMANHKVRKMPFIGWLAASIDTIFVNRDNKVDRQRAQDETVAKLVNQNYPPLAIFPEGKIGPGDDLLPLRFGAFEISRDAQLPFLPCVLSYTPLEVAKWRPTESMMSAAWRLASRKGPFYADIIALEKVLPEQEADAEVLSTETREAMIDAFSDKNRSGSAKFLNSSRS